MRHLGSEAGALVMPYASNLCDCMWAELRSISTWLEGFSPGAPVFLPYPNRLTPNITSAWLWCWALTSDMDRFRPSCALRKIQQQREDEHAQPSILFYSIPFHSIPFHSMLCYSTLLYSILFYSVSARGNGRQIFAVFCPYLSSRHSTTFKPRSNEARAEAKASAMHRRTPAKQEMQIKHT